mgnify:CR=1 FL=1
MTYSWLNKYTLYIAAFALLLLTAACQNQSTPTPFDPVKQAEIDDQIIQDFLTKKGITATKTASGLYYVIDSTNTSGISPTSGQRVFVRYEGRFLDDAQTVFDQNLNSASDLSFIVGSGTVIKGFDEAVRILRRGEQGRFFLPSGLGYGNSGNIAIRPNTCLQFMMRLNNVE